MFFEPNRAMVNMSDLKDIYNNGHKTTFMKGEYYWNQKDDFKSFRKDPGGGTIQDRLEGRFQWAQDFISKQKSVFQIGNVSSYVPEYEFGHMVGTEIDFDQYFKHDPRCLGVLKNNESDDGQRVIRIAVGLGGSAWRTSEDMATQTAKTLKVAKQYEEAGYGVELYGMYASFDKEDRKPGVYLIDCSRASVGQAVSVLCSTKLFRTIGFTIMACMGHSPGWSYPIWTELENRLMPECEKIVKSMIGNDTKVIFPGYSDEQITKILSQN